MSSYSFYTHQLMGGNIKRQLFAFVTLFTISFHTYSQELTQTVRGVVLDADSKSPLVGV